ncbi:hypothetical protein JMUB7507_26630 [Staphylococcus aureus]
MLEVGYVILHRVPVTIYLLVMLLIGVFLTKRASHRTNSLCIHNGL